MGQSIDTHLFPVKIDASRKRIQPPLHYLAIAAVKHHQLQFSLQAISCELSNSFALDLLSVYYKAGTMQCSVWPHPPDSGPFLSKLFPRNQSPLPAVRLLQHPFFFLMGYLRLSTISQKGKLSNCFKKIN